MQRSIAIAAAGAVAVIVGGALVATTILAPADRLAACRQGNVAGGFDRLGGPFTLVDGSGATVTDADVITEPSLVYFGYTSCPDVCPVDNARNAAAVDVLEEDHGIAAQPVFITIDPARDTPEVMGDYARNMHPRMVGLSGSEEQVAAAAKAYSTYYAKSGDDPDYYLMDHQTMTYLALPGQGTVEFFGRDDGPEEVAERTACLVAAAS
ncbi:SCO family protein [Limimaricola pyoseonensis]|uniref:Protein SCO1/2 n=1 Tax=Limimaricola pyoseonensis TaxID=521013 RepID=A0A1G7EKL4_9RHOB|nr:SCO family protein [Limimaricola pyoseonensis]SDE64127.1 protein SCO1/2 [Limimaricola pyoseonensis]